MAYYRDHRERHPNWPHFDNRGPEYYYMENGPSYNDRDQYERWRDPRYEEPRYARQRYERDSDIYEDEFYSREEGDHRPRYDSRDRWPEDEFYYNRRQLHPRENFFERTGNRIREMWMDMRGRPSNGPFPEEHQREFYGRDIHARNANRGYHRRPNHW